MYEEGQFLVYDLGLSFHVHGSASTGVCPAASVPLDAASAAPKKCVHECPKWQRVPPKWPKSAAGGLILHHPGSLLPAGPFLAFLGTWARFKYFCAKPIVFSAIF